jgi:hypothetical protein
MELIAAAEADVILDIDEDRGARRVHYKDEFITHAPVTASWRRPNADAVQHNFDPTANTPSSS